MNRENDPRHLHPDLRGKSRELIARLAAENLPFQVFEGFRWPQRQAYLYAQGRSRPGGIVTYARPWQSPHQYGLGFDVVLKIDGQWSWDTSGERRLWWERLHEVGRELGLQPLSFEKPHLQMAGLDIDELKAGHFPMGGDSDWAENLEKAILSWGGSPPAPPKLPEPSSRPPLEAADGQPLTRSVGPPLSAGDWHNRFGGIDWRFDEKGVYLKDHGNGQTPLRTPGAPITCRKIMEVCGDEIEAAAKNFQIPMSIILMVIATETGFLSRQGFTGSRSFRWEPGVKVTDVDPPTYGDYSAGPMQTLASTARWIIQTQRLDYDRFQVAPYYARRPEAPEQHPLYEYDSNITIGTAEIKQRWESTGHDPILVAAAYNAGGLYQTDDNRWHLRSYGDHLDRAAAWFGDACEVLKQG